MAGTLTLGLPGRVCQNQGQAPLGLFLHVGPWGFLEGCMGARVGLSWGFVCAKRLSLVLCKVCGMLHDGKWGHGLGM